MNLLYVSVIMNAYVKNPTFSGQETEEKKEKDNQKRK